VRMIMLASQPMMPPTISQMMKFIEFPRLVGLLMMKDAGVPTLHAG